jgi:hypothetical protein
MKKGVLVAVAIVAVAAAAAAGWWFGREGKGIGQAGDAPEAARPLTAAERTARAERLRKAREHRNHLWREASYVEIRQAATDGDAVAQRRLSEIYEDCTAYAGPMSGAMRIIGSMAKAKPASERTVVGIYNDYKRFCVQAEADLRKNPGAADYWLHRSAKSGDLTAEMRYFGRTVVNLDPDQVGYFVGKLKASPEPDAMFEMSLLLPKLRQEWPDAAQAPAFNNAVAQHAWAVAACRAGHDCVAGSRVMNLLCVGMLSCDQPDYEHYLALTTGYLEQRATVERLVAMIDRDILER